MTQNDLSAWRSKKSKALSKKWTVGTPTYRKILNVAHIGHFLEKIHHLWRFLPTMKSCGVLLPVLLVLSGCLASPIKPSHSRMGEMRTILVVPVESPPLEVIPDQIETRFPVYSQYQAMPYYLFLEQSIYKNPGGVLISGLVSQDDIVPIADLHQPSASTEKIASLESASSVPENWTPTFILAQEAVSQLHGERVKAMLSKQYYRLPIASGDRNANLGNWHDAIEQWYDQNMSSVDYRQPELEQVDAILEVGIGTYRIFDAQTSLQVLLKLIDPNTRQVIGRISAKTFSAEDSPQTLLNHEAEKFKQLVTLMGAQLLTRAFGDLGLPLDVTGQPINYLQSAADTLTP
ncbi:MAG: hypothetical protein WC685_02360 [Methylobacter sp.]|jgi:hypothetical protein